MGQTATKAANPATDSRDVPAPSTPPPVKSWTTHVDKYASKEPVRITRAAYAKDDGTTVFLADNVIAQVTAEKETPESTTVLIQHWPKLLQAGIHRIDAILPDPKLSETHHICIFSKNFYVRLNELTGEVVEGPSQISQSWTALREAGFQTIDAVLPHPSNKATFFSRDQYATITFDLLKDGVRSNLIGSGPFASQWPSLAAFKSIDYALPERDDKNVANFFSGPDYVSAEIEPAPEPTAVARGGRQYTANTQSPEPNRIADRWTALEDVGFY